MERWTFTDHVLDPKARLLWRAGRPLHLEPKVMDLLIHLVEHHDQFVSKQALYQQLWGNWVVSQASLTRLIKELRRALGDDGERQRFIRTVNARGYQFVADVERSRVNPQRSAASDPESEQEVTAPASSAGGPQDSALCLHVLSPRHQASITLTGSGPFRVGRDPQSEVLIYGERASRQHAEIVRHGPAYFIRDRGSRNGTFVAGARIAQAPLRRGQLLRAGDFLALVADASEAYPADTSQSDEARALCVGPRLQRALEPIGQTSAQTPIVLRGETGTGKASIARCIHAWSGAQGGIQQLHCAGLDAAVLTRTFDQRALAAKSGTLLLLDVDRLAPELAYMLMRMLDRLGRAGPRVLGTSTRSDVAILWNACVIELPALRDRLVDLPGLVQHFLRSGLAGRSPELSVRLLEALCAYDWPGNVRELQQLVEVIATSHARADRLSLEHLPSSFVHALGARSSLPDSDVIFAQSRAPTRSSLRPRQVP